MYPRRLILEGQDVKMANGFSMKEAKKGGEGKLNKRESCEGKIVYSVCCLLNLTSGQVKGNSCQSNGFEKRAKLGFW